MSVRDINTSEVIFQETLDGGNAVLLPASNTLSIHGEATLAAGNLYRLQVVLDANDLGEPNPSIYDANGFANFSIRPVPEPHTALLLVCAVPMVVGRRPRRRRSLFDGRKD